MKNTKKILNSLPDYQNWNEIEYDTYKRQGR